MSDAQKKLYKIEFEERTDYLFVRVSGDKDSYEISKQFWLEIAERCRLKNRDRVLVFENIKECVSETDMYRIASELPQMGFSGVRIAFVDCYQEQQPVNEFGGIVAGNRGISGRVFNNVEDAEKWLLSK